MSKPKWTPVFSVTEKFDVKNLKVEDGGNALIYTPDTKGDMGMFVRIQSWDEDKEHFDMEKISGKKIRITVEILN